LVLGGEVYDDNNNMTLAGWAWVRKDVKENKVASYASGETRWGWRDREKHRLPDEQDQQSSFVLSPTPSHRKWQEGEGQKPIPPNEF
jgi:hypothetical protein